MTEDEYRSEIARLEAELELARKPEGPLPIGPLLDERLQPGQTVVVKLIAGTPHDYAVASIVGGHYVRQTGDKPSITLRSVLLLAPVYRPVYRPNTRTQPADAAPEEPAIATGGGGHIRPRGQIG